MNRIEWANHLNRALEIVDNLNDDAADEKEIALLRKVTKVLLSLAKRRSYNLITLEEHKARQKKQKPTLKIAKSKWTEKIILDKPPIDTWME